MKGFYLFSFASALAFALASTTDATNEHHDHRQKNDTLNVSSQTLTDPYPYYFPVLDAQKKDDTPFPMPLCYGARIEEASIAELQGYLTDGTLTSAKLVECYMRRILQVDTYVE